MFCISVFNVCVSPLSDNHMCAVRMPFVNYCICLISLLSFCIHLYHQL